jgi:hypothetical protein
MTWRLILGIVCLLLGFGGIYKNLQHGLPPDTPPGFVVGLYTPAIVLIAASIALLAWEWTKRRRRG